MRRSRLDILASQVFVEEIQNTGTAGRTAASILSSLLCADRCETLVNSGEDSSSR